MKLFAILLAVLGLGLVVVFVRRRRRLRADAELWAEATDQIA